ncbi:sarcosine oxidase subunit delta [Antarcticimicrobium luteum]|uniref:Sarcosine oxidase subunit delta n=1 Tax=Antarcticimicrobium luteum TaxID=2547397 RepID=A0A4R5VED7_9RHOB|nr:sarcosine oxidase subunit delta [Antarcticimicrobium luteum]TDK50562.1 sarcosine oxidase subunit delta [Antarcticimicrobium luteum]
MQLFPCPFCGPRDEREFHFAAEAGKTRPDTTGAVSEADWAAYLYDRRNDKGRVREVWMHLPCREVFVMERDSVSMEVLGTTAFRKAGA